MNTREELEQAAQVALTINGNHTENRYSIKSMTDNQLRGLIEYPTFEALEQKLGGFIVNPNADYEEYPDKFETYGDDVQAVLARLETHPRTVFTVQDSDDGDMMIMTGGYHLCNRLYYVITNNPVPENIDYDNICIRMCIYENP